MRRILCILLICLLLPVGVGVTARGSNAFPEGYFKVKSAIRDFFFNLMDQYGIDDYAID